MCVRVCVLVVCIGRTGEGKAVWLYLLGRVRQVVQVDQAGSAPQQPGQQGERGGEVGGEVGGAGLLVCVCVCVCESMCVQEG